ncbi:MAG: phosphatase PAP2 family protein [Bryobacteraceae bacterium]|jgi:undecaprenyl-diphosphatase
MTPAFDEPIRALVHAHASPALTVAMRAISALGEPAFLIVLGVPVVFWLVRTGRTRAMLRFAIAIVGAEVLDQLLKLLFHRARPTIFFGLPKPMGYSFPSGHALVSFAFFGALVVFASPRRWWYYIAAAVPIAAIGYSRIYLGMHYPSDVLGGWAAAAIWLFSVSWARRATMPAGSRKPL